MFDGLSGMDWIFLVAALALGFGVVKFMISVNSARQTEVQTATVPSVRQASDVQVPDGKTPGNRELDFDELDVAGAKRWLEERKVELSKDVPWYDVLKVSKTASWQEIEEAFARKWKAFSPGRLNTLMGDLSFIADGGLDGSMDAEHVSAPSKTAAAASDLKVQLVRLLVEMQSAREEGMSRRRHGFMD